MADNTENVVSIRPEPVAPAITPGTWEVGQHPAMTTGWIVRPVLFGRNASALPECEGGHIVLRNEADAHLIAAAPKLYNVLKKIAALRRYDSNRGTNSAGLNTTLNLKNDLIQQIDDALAEAVGEPITVTRYS